MSPLLFCIAEDVLSRAICKLVQEGKLNTMAGPRGFRSPSHILYADDILIFCRASTQNLSNLMSLFKEYGEASGQMVNLHKSKFYAGNISANRMSSIANALGFTTGRFPFTYLGLPMFKGNPRKSHLQSIADRIKSKLATWKGCLLSIMGRVQLVKSVVVGMMMYSFQVYSWPLSLLKLVDSWLRNFIWSGNTDIKKTVTVAWHKLCKPEAEGGLGVRSLRAVNNASMLKLYWDFISSYEQ